MNLDSPRLPAITWKFALMALSLALGFAAARLLRSEPLAPKAGPSPSSAAEPEAQQVPPTPARDGRARAPEQHSDARVDTKERPPATEAAGEPIAYDGTGIADHPLSFYWESMASSGKLTTLEKLPPEQRKLFQWAVEDKDRRLELDRRLDYEMGVAPWDERPFQIFAVLGVMPTWITGCQRGVPASIPQTRAWLEAHAEELGGAPPRSEIVERILAEYQEEEASLRWKIWDRILALKGTRDANAIAMGVADGNLYVLEAADLGLESIRMYGPFYDILGKMAEEFSCAR